MNLAERLADWLTGGDLTRTRDDLARARRSIRAMTEQVGVDVPIADHIEVVQLLGAVLSRFREPVPGAQTAADAPPATVARWRARHAGLAGRLRADRRLAHHAEQQRTGAEVSTGG